MGYDAQKFGYVRAVGLSEDLRSEVTKVSGDHRVSIAWLLARLVEREDFGDLVLKAHVAGRAGRGARRLDASLPRPLTQKVAELGENLELPKERVISLGLYSLRGRVASLVAGG